MSGKSVLRFIFGKMNSATNTKIPSAETVEKLENLAALTEKRIEQLKSEVVEMQKTLEEHKLFASNVLSTKHKELLEENKKLRNEIEEWKRKVFAMEGKLGVVETKVGDSIGQNKTLLDKLNEQNEKLNKHGEKLNSQGNLLNKQNEKLTAQEGKLFKHEEKLNLQGDLLNKQNEKLTAQEGKLCEHEEKLSKQEEMLNQPGEKISSQTVKTKEKKAKKEETASDKAESVDVGRLDIRVGKILSVKKHPDAETLYVEQIDVGEEKPRNVVSGLVKFVPMQELENRMVVVVCNMKPSKMRGVVSEAMVLCASDTDKVEVLNPPKGALPGERVLVDGFSINPDSVLNPKKKIFETVAVDLKTDLSKRATYKGKPFYVPDKGLVTSTTLTDANIK